ncbi:MAG: flagellar M-ring protein FliF [Oscillospiraceae bacterium]|nr:flagellar M-ring protein FliF [Oscillospiraceae bacterium]
MPERVKQIWGRIRDFFKNMKKGLKIGLIAGVAVIIALVAIVVVLQARRPYVVLFGGLSSEDLTSVVTYLNTAGVTDLKIQNNDTVLVRESQADRLRAVVIQQGYPTTGYSHDTYFDNISALSSSADREQLALYDLQEFLASTIRCFDGVEDAVVTITPGEDHRYILDESVTEATAGVFVQMKHGKTLSKDQVAAIQRWVASAEKGLTVNNVTVEDGAGNRYTSGAGGTSDVLDDTMKYKLALEAQVNEEVRNSIMNVFATVLGAENVEVSVHSTVDVSRTYSESTVYHEPSWAADGSSEGKGIIGRQIWDNSSVFNEDATVGGAVGTTSNTEINEYVTNPDQLNGSEREWYRSGEIDYNVSQDNIQREQPPGTITDLTVAIAINSAKYNLQNPASFVHLAATAAGITAEQEGEKIAIVSIPFYQSGGGMTTVVGEPSMILGIPAWAVYAAIAGVALFLALMLVILLLRSKKKKRLAILLAQEQRAAEEAAAAEAAALAAAQEAAGADIMDVHTEESMQMRQDVRQFVEENPTIAAQMIKNWLRGGDEMQ